MNGRGTISRDAGLLESFEVNGRAPTTVLLIEIRAVYFQCGRALMRSGLRDPGRRTARDSFPTAGEMIRAADRTFDSAAYDRELPARQCDTLY